MGRRVRHRPPPQPYKLDAADIKTLNLTPCPFCGGMHTGLCRRVIEIEYYEGGGVKRALLRETWDTSTTTWLWEIEE